MARSLAQWRGLLAGIQIQIYEGSRRNLLSLFRLADESESQILSYYEMGSVLVARDRDFVVGMAHIVEDADVFEIVSLAVILERRGEGIGRQLVEEAVTYCRLNNAVRLVVCTGSWETDNIIFYLRRGFRIFNVARDYFTSQRGYTQTVRDQVQFEMLS
jgi:GNAT superfamily N-acetyltransferase